jgi:hypothetical protein
MVVVLLVLVVAAGAALAVVQTGVFRTSSTPSGHSAPPPHSATTLPRGPFLRQISVGTGTAAYSVPVPAYAVTVTTTTGRSWISIGAPGQHPVFAGILNPNSVQHEILLGPAEVDIGAGGTKVTVSSGKHSTTLKPPSAPFSYQFTPGSG